MLRLLKLHAIFFSSFWLLFFLFVPLSFPFSVLHFLPAQVLLLTRDNRKAVRLASIRVIHRLFTEAADEYLTLLPECLPFLSELMEDSSRDVVAAASEAIKFIEELSGEKLDTYLQ